jgi:MFS family permease
MKNPRSTSLAPLYEREYRLFVIARFCYTMALRMVTTVVAYELFQLTKNSFSIGLLGLSEFVPVFALALYAGHVIDRSDKRTLLLRGILLYAICISVLLLLTSNSVQLKISKGLLEFLFYVVIFFTGIIRAFAGPTTSAIIAQLVPRNILQYAANINSTTYLSASIFGHATGGFCIAWFGVHNTFYIVLLLAVSGALFMSRIGKKPVMHQAANVKTWDSVKAGLSYVFRHKILLGAISLDLFAVLFGGAAALIPEFSEKILHVGPIGFGWLNASIDIGSIIMIITMTLWPLRRNQGRTLFFAVAGFGICIIAFGLSDVFWMAFAAMVIAGMMDGISVIIRGTVLQLTTPDDMRGRVSSVNSMFINSSNELGQFESGLVAGRLGAVPSIIFGGSMTLIVVIITWFKAPGLRKFQY